MCVLICRTYIHIFFVWMRLYIPCIYSHRFFVLAGASSSAYSIPWPGFMADLFAQMRYALLDVYQIAAVDCWSNMSFYTPFYFTTCGTLAFLLISAIVHHTIPCVFARCFPSLDSANNYWRSVCLKILVIVMTVLYPGTLFGFPLLIINGHLHKYIMKSCDATLLWCLFCV